MDMKKVTAGALAATVLTLGGGAALAAGQNPATAQNGGAAATQEQSGQEEQDPSYTGSIKASGGQDSENEGAEGKETAQSEAAEDKSEAAEEQQLQSLAKIDQQAAEQAALQAVPGQAAESELGNENGYVVYEVEIKGDDGQTHEVKVDAGNGDILAQEIDDDSGESESGESEASKSQQAPATTGGK